MTIFVAILLTILSFIYVLVFSKTKDKKQTCDGYLFASSPDSIPSLCRKGRNHYARTQRVRCNLNSYAFESRRCLCYPRIVIFYKELPLKKEYSPSISGWTVSAGPVDLIPTCNNKTKGKKEKSRLALFYTRGLGIVVLHVLVPEPYIFHLCFLK